MPWADSVPSVAAPAYGFPLQPVALTSSGQEVLLKTYPSCAGANCGAGDGATIIAVTGERIVGSVRSMQGVSATWQPAVASVPSLQQGCPACQLPRRPTRCPLPIRHT